ncbi:D-arabinono-1,4-lactone oxidase [Quadrisphaera sp. DSM 44207]|uniref:D-arabinono-1,4-lactone oxidase n=1 Tax=Quadrisphaera sp. DSM 44207 TaxID=1881057 RepID=UPI000890DA65|nr:D-arabinono-1,4-lactone oxidase [Quadrisphaera sp. DSM 44207]SDQ36651.1 xylitol oxidase [Quadrisphaera sp. DSM 44207]
MGERGSNWAGNYTYRASQVHRPRTLEELQEVVARAPRLKALGTRHSFNGVADTEGAQVSLADLPRRAELDADPEAGTGTVTVDGGSSYGALAVALQERGWALRNLASLPHICVAGAVATATHGSGDGNRSLADAVRAVELVTGGGQLVRMTREDDAFAGAVVHLGALGVVTALELEVVPTYDVRQDVYEDLPWDVVHERFDEITTGVYSVSLFTAWSPRGVDQVWRKSLVPAGSAGSAPPDLFGARPATRARHPLPGMSGENCTPQGGVPGPWLDRLPHFQLRFTPSSGEEVQSEYLLPRSAVHDALAAMRGLHERVAPLLQACEVRTVAPDDLWLSPTCGQDSVGIHFTWQRRQGEVERVLRDVEAALVPLGARPHWGKVSCVLPHELAAPYERLEDFRALARRLDPQGTFTSGFTRRVLQLG